MLDVDSKWYLAARPSETSDDLRDVYSADRTLDLRGVHSLLQFGAVIPPLSVWREVRRAIPSPRISEQDRASSVSDARIPICAPGTLGAQQETVLGILDRLIAQASPKGRLIVLFSGGVDSGLLAARAAVLGFKDAVLVHYSFGAGDAETILAERMARHLGLRFWRIEHSGDDATADTLKNAGNYYRVPFCDHSTVPTCALVRSVCKEFGTGHVVLDGTGADGAFGMTAKAEQWIRLCGLSGPALRLGGALYRIAKLWSRESTVERYCRLMRRAFALPYPLAAVAQNPLEGIAYEVDADVRDEVNAIAMDWLRSFCPQDPRRELTAIDMALTCANIFAQKSWSLFRDAGVPVVYPFLSPEMFDVAMQLTAWPGAPEPKWVLKAALEQSVPVEMVRRPKSGFTARTAEIFRHPAFLEAYRPLADGTSPISGMLKSEFFEWLRPKISAGHPVPAQTANLIWGAVFTSQWLTQVKQRKIRAGTDAASASICEAARRIRTDVD
ncbi:MAG: asparagine synthase C-terminal domain-containing protein [Bryobacteraceae bacterium]